MIVLAIVSLASSADARPKRRDARAAFDRGVAAYRAGDFEAASAALSKSYELERDVETMFAWAQSERQRGHCENAIDLYDKLLTMKLPAKNKEAVERTLSECRAILAQQKSVTPPPVAPPDEPPPAPSKPLPAPEPPPPRVAERVEVVPEPPPPTDTAPPSSAWYKNPVAIGLLSTGVVSTGVGAGFLLSAKSFESKERQNVDEARDFNEKARSRGNIGLVAGSVGGALVISGVVWIVLHRGATDRPAVTGWLAPGGGGVAVAGAF